MLDFAPLYVSSRVSILHVGFGGFFKGKSTPVTVDSKMEQGPCSSLLCSLDLDEVASPVPCPSQPALRFIKWRLIESNNEQRENTIERQVHAKETAPLQMQQNGGHTYRA